MSALDAALGYEPPAGGDEVRIWVPLGGSHRVAGLSESQRRKLVSAVAEARPEFETRLVLLGVDVDGLRPAGRAALLERIAYLPADGGLLSNLNAWENMVLPIGFHRRNGLHNAAARVNGMLRGLGADPDGLLPKLPERMSLYEKKLTGYVRIALERPDLILVEDSPRGLNPAERAAAARFPGAYLESNPGSTYVQLEIALDR